MARPRTLDESKQREICALVSVGCSLSAAARYVGCNSITIRREASRNADFCQRLRHAETSSQVSPLHAVRRAAESHWRAAAWLLERTDPDRFARRDPTKLTPAHLEAIVQSLSDILVREIRDKETFLRIDKALVAMMRDLERTIRCGIEPLRDPPQLAQLKRLAQESEPVSPPSESLAAEPSARTLRDKT